MQKKSFQARYFGHHFNLIKMESCGKENLFNGSCVKIMDDKVIYTGKIR